ncbi:MAG: SCO6745 family protein, partial [Nitrososphaerales archaeon]
MTTDATMARLVWQFGEPVQAVTYYVPEVRRRTDELGLRGGWMSYFGCRAAPLGAVAPAVVCAVFYNFHPRMVHRAIPDAWTLASPAQLLDARLEAMDEALCRLLGDVDSIQMRRAADLARGAVESVDYSGRPLGAANAGLPAPSAAHLSLWQSLATLREYRGDGHVASLVGATVSPCAALVLHSATGRSDPDALRTNRGWTEDEWAIAVEGLQTRGWVDSSGAVTQAGRAARDELEDTTDRLAALIVAGIGIESAGEL